MPGREALMGLVFSSAGPSTWRGPAEQGPCSPLPEVEARGVCRGQPRGGGVGPPGRGEGKRLCSPCSGNEGLLHGYRESEGSILMRRPLPCNWEPGISWAEDIFLFFSTKFSFRCAASGHAERLPGTQSRARLPGLRRGYLRVLGAGFKFSGGCSYCNHC